MHWRIEVLRAVFGQEPDKRLLVANRSYYRTHAADGTHIAYVAQFDGKDAGCGAVCIGDELPSPDNPGGHCAYLMNIYVRPQYRKHGIAHAIVRVLIEEAKARCCDKIYLETTLAGRPIYESLGFVEMSDMMILPKKTNKTTTDEPKCHLIG